MLILAESLELASSELFFIPFSVVVDIFETLNSGIFCEREW